MENIPDREQLSNEWYEWLMAHSPHFKTLGMDQQGEMVAYIVDYHMKHDAPIPMGKVPESNVESNMDRYEKNMK
jgi:hypothetical protein